MSSNFLLLNDKKTELIEYNSNGLNQNNDLVIGNTVIDTQPCVTNLGCVLDVGLVMSSYAARMCKSAYHHLRCIRKIRNCIHMEACKLLVHSLVTSRLDYSNALLCGARDDVIKQLERVQRIAARVVCKKYTNDHSSVTEHQSTSSIQNTITCVQSSSYRYPTLLGSPAYTKVLLQGESPFAE